ncbi:MAG: methyltransferase domain-containing protein [Candidatus Electronema sp. V4]|uniref:methyltransferase domain-containing protein n=1 Tax=Candidatus Electronema sp. V4 TaxID=3454756 RepID=UPI004055790F
MKKIGWQYNGEVEVVDYCILCESNHSTEVDSNFSNRLGLIDPFKCRKCSTCGLRWLSPRPTQEGYKLIYTMDNYFGGEYSQESFSILEKSRAKLFRDRLKRTSRLFNEYQGGKTLLDIGAATGQFVYEANMAGYNAFGIELSPEAIEQARKRYSVSLRQQSLQDLITQGYKFDIIHMNHVFEHILDPTICLKQCKKLLNVNGVLIIEVPQQFYNNLDKLKDILLMNSKHLFTPYSLHHTYFYTPNTLTMLLKDNGFAIRSLRTSNPANTPLWPISFKNIFLLIYLHCSDYLKQGNIIEIFSKAC